MEKAEPTGSLHEIEEEDFYGLGLDHNLLNTPLQSSNSPSLSSKNYVIKQNQMFSSPLNGSLNVGYLTPIANYSSLGFTPWTPIGQGSGQKSGRPELNVYEILNFDQHMDQKGHLGRQGDQTTARKRIQDEIYEQVSNRKRQTKPGRSQRRRKEPTMEDYVRTEVRSHRGLRNLASAVKCVATKLGVATSKQISQALVQELDLQKQFGKNTKQFSNIKRRVYDALKVLISADVLIKDKKNMIARPTGASSASLEQYRNSLKAKVEAVKKSIEEKSQKALNLNNKSVVRSQLIEKNKMNPADEDKRIYFPFLAITMKEDDLDFIQVNDQKNAVELAFKEPRMKIMGDLDFILEMKILEQKNKETALRSQQQLKIQHCQEIEKQIKMEKQVKVEEQEHNPEEIEPRPIITKRKYTKKSSPSKKL